MHGAEDQLHVERVALAPCGGLFACMTKLKKTPREPVPLLTCSLPDAESRMIPLAELQENTRGATNFLKSGMRCSGQLTPIVVVELPTGEYDVRDGNRRVAAGKALGWTEIKAEVYRNLSEPELALVVLSLHNRSENPVEEARLYQLLSKGLTAEGIAANTGHPVARVRARLTLLNLPDDVLALVGSKTLSLGVAQSAARLKGAFLQNAVLGIRAAAGKEERYGNQELREVTVARRNALGSLLAVCAPQAVPLIPPAEVLALEVRDLCRIRGVSVTALLQEFSAAGLAERAG